MKSFFEQNKRKEHPAHTLKNILATQAKNTNDTLEQEWKLSGVLTDEGAIDARGYQELYGEASLQYDEQEVRTCEVDFSGAKNPNVQAFYKETYGAQTEDDVITRWRENKTREKNGQMEMAVTALLSEKLGKDFLVARTATYDDYKNGVDTLIFDRTTGEVVGAFDEVHEGGAGDRTKKKEAKIKIIAQRGGATIRYGLALVDGAWKRAELKNVPVFYLGLESAQLTELIEGLAQNDEEKTSAIFNELLLSLTQQHAELERSVKDPLLQKRVAGFKQSINRMKNGESRM